MSTKILYILLIAFSLVSLPLYAEWDKETKKEFLRANEYRYIFDTDKTSYCGMDSIDFVEYNAAKNNMTIENYAIILKYIGARLKKALEEETHKQFSENSISNFMIYIHLDELSEKAGMKVTVITCVDSIDNGQTYRFKIDDGRWNKFDVLLQENLELLAEKISNKTRLKMKSVFTKRKDTDFDPLYN